MTFTITAKTRALRGDKVREQGAIPAVLYGPEISPASLIVESVDFDKLYRAAGESSLVDLKVDSAEPRKVLIADIQRDPVSSRIIHADFRQINMNKPITAALGIRFVGESPAVKGLGGTLVKGPDIINIKCLPKDLVSHIDVDISSLSSFDISIYLKDLAIPAGITILDNPETLIVTVSAPLTEEEIKAMEAAGPASIEEVKVISEEEKAKKAAEAAAAGEAEAGEKKEAKDAKKDEKK